MTREEKEILIKDLSARLPYGVLIQEDYTIGDEMFLPIAETDRLVGIDVDAELLMTNGGSKYHIDEFKLYLFPLSSMTEEQYKEMQDIVGNPNDACIMIKKVLGLELWLNSVDTDPTIWLNTIFEVQDWLNKNHFDYRGLIEKGLAIDATELNIY